MKKKNNNLLLAILFILIGVGSLTATMMPVKQGEVAFSTSGIIMVLVGLILLISSSSEEVW